MTDPKQDPRVAAMVDALYGWDPTSPPPDDYRAKEELARLDAADPLRALLPEVVEGLEWIIAETAAHGSIRWPELREAMMTCGVLSASANGEGLDGVVFSPAFVALLTRLQALTTDTGDES